MTNVPKVCQRLIIKPIYTKACVPSVPNVPKHTGTIVCQVPSIILAHLLSLAQLRVKTKETEKNA
jgi:hypothetical protein